MSKNVKFRALSFQKPQAVKNGSKGMPHISQSPPIACAPVIVKSHSR